LYTLNQKVLCHKYVRAIQLYFGPNRVLLGVVVPEKSVPLWVGVDELLRVRDRGGATGSLWPALNLEFELKKLFSNFLRKYFKILLNFRKTI